MNYLSFLHVSEPLRRELAILCALVAGFLLLLATVLIWAPSTMDREFTRAMQGIPWSSFGFIPRLGSDVGGGTYGAVLFPALVGTWAVATRRWRLLVLLAGVFALHYVLISPKLFITAYRPSPAFGVEGGGGLESFPSGHVQWAVSFYGLLTYLSLQSVSGNARRYAIAGLFALVVALTMVGRIELGRHWLTDTVAGVIAGVIALRLLMALHRWDALDRLTANARELGVRLLKRVPQAATAEPNS